MPSATRKPRVPRNPIGFRQRVQRLQGLPVQFDLSAYHASLAGITALDAEFSGLSDADLRARASGIRLQARAGAPRESLRVALFAAAREAARRAIGLRPVDVQVIAALAMDDGRVVEMQTGEGKTLAAVLPAALNALAGAGVHVLTFNDYLARRDAEWMGPAYRMLGLTVGSVQQGMKGAERREAYGADVTYVTAKEAGFDYLRDQLVMDVREEVHRPFHFALVDEADSLLIDEARIPLVIAGSVDQDPVDPTRLAALAATLAPGEHFDTDEYARDVELTEAGIERMEQLLGCGTLHSDQNYSLLTQVNCALHARVLLRRNVDYLVRGGRIEVIDEFTGRVVPDRRWPDGLQAALEAKEGLDGRHDGRILGSVTLQHFLRRYPRLCGMTGTACDAARELRTLYGLDVVVVPTHRPMIRIDRPDVVFTHREAKDAAVVAEIIRVHATGRPVLVGTQTVEESEHLAGVLSRAGVECQVLNARNDAAEARIVSRAGAPGVVTISTNMAGRGTDIRLGGEDEAERDRVAGLGGLYVIGTSRHEHRRIDRQLRGRAGRQGDPGESRFFISLDDDLLARHGLRGLLPGRLLPPPRREPVDDRLVARRIDQAQRVVEGQSLEMRHLLFQYGSVLEEQRVDLMARRRAVLTGEVPPAEWGGASGQRRALVEAVGEAAVRRAESTVTLRWIDRAWRDHLAACADLREGIHLVGLAGEDPLVRYAVETRVAFERLERTVSEGVKADLERLRAGKSGIDLDDLAVQAPASTWTYLVNDPFADHIARMLTGPGGKTVAMYSAVMLMPLFMAWVVAERWVRRFLARRARG